MLTRRDVLNRLKLMGVRELSNLKKECRDFEYYMALNYDLKIPRSGYAEDPTCHPPSPALSNKDGRF